MTASAPGRSCSVRLTSNEPFGRVVLAAPFQAIRRSCTSATRQTTPRTAVVDLEPHLDAVVAALQPQLRGRAAAADTGDAHLAAAVLRDCRDGPGGEERQHADSDEEHEQTAADPESELEADHTTQSAEPPLGPQRDLGRIGYGSRSPRSPCRSTQRMAWTRSVTPI